MAKTRERARANAYAAMVDTVVDKATAPTVTIRELVKYSPKWPSVHALR